MQIFSTKSIFNLTIIAFGVLGLQSHAAVVFTDNSYVKTIGEASRTDESRYRYYDVQSKNYEFFETSTEPSIVSASVNYGIGLLDEFDYDSVSSSTIRYLKGSYYDSGATASINGYGQTAADTVANHVGENATAYSRAVFDIDFTIDTAYSYNMFNYDMGAFGNASVYFGLFNIDTQSYVFNGEASEINRIYDQLLTGSLSAGSYNLVVESTSRAQFYENSVSSAEFALELTAVPVPTAIWLFGSGLLGLAGFARRKSK